MNDDPFAAFGLLLSEATTLGAAYTAELRKRASAVSRMNASMAKQSTTFWLQGPP